MSPEQVLGKAVDHRTDFFSFGVLLYEMATGARPFAGEGMELTLSCVRDEPRPPASVSPRVSPSLARVIDRCLAKDPAQRYPDARALAADLELTMEGPRAASAATSSPQVGPSTARGTVRGHRRHLALAATVLMVLAVAAGVRWRARAPRAPPFSELGLPAWARPEAVAAYRAGLQLDRDAGESYGWNRYLEAAAADSRLAQPHLRLAILATRGSPSDAREHFAKATELRFTLTARDEELRMALAPCVQSDVMDNLDCARRLATAGTRLAGDAELQELAAEFYFNGGLLDEAIAYSERAVELDPGYASAWGNIGYATAYLGRRDEAEAAFARCLAVSQAGFSCLSFRDDLYAEDGRCDLVEADARKAVALLPSLSSSYRLLEDALVGVGRPAAAVREVLRQELACTPESQRPATEAAVEARLAALAGDFNAAEKRARELGRLVESSAQEGDHAEPSQLLVELYRETGRPREAAAIAEEFLVRRTAWVADPRGDDFAIMRDPTPILVAAQLRGGRLPPAAGRAAMADYFRRHEERSPPFYRRYLWIQGLASPAETAEEARAALAQLPAFAPLPSFMPLTLGWLSVGKTYLLAGRVDEAMPFLERAATHCLVAQHPFEAVRAHLLRGEAHQARGDVAKACADYREVLRRWGKARPRSLSAEEASRRSQRLGCSLQ
jgi:serine/threonine-protein kinase